MTELNCGVNLFTLDPRVALHELCPCLSSEATTFDLINAPFTLNDFEYENDMANRQFSDAYLLGHFMVNSKENLCFRNFSVNGPLAKTIFCTGISRPIFEVKVMKKG